MPAGFRTTTNFARSELPWKLPISPLEGEMSGRTEGAPGASLRSIGLLRRAAPTPLLRSDPPHKGEDKDHPAIAIGTALLLGIWISISRVDIVSPRSIETCK